MQRRDGRLDELQTGELRTSTESPFANLFKLRQVGQADRLKRLALPESENSNAPQGREAREVRRGEMHATVQKRCRQCFLAADKFAKLID